MSTNKDEYFCRDLGEAAAHYCQGSQPIRLEPKEKFFLFVFLNPSSCKEIAKRYWFGELQVNAKDYFIALKNLKSLLYTYTPRGVNRWKTEENSHNNLYLCKFYENPQKNTLSSTHLQPQGEIIRT